MTKTMVSPAADPPVDPFAAAAAAALGAVPIDTAEDTTPLGTSKKRGHDKVDEFKEPQDTGDGPPPASKGRKDVDVKDSSKDEENPKIDGARETPKELTSKSVHSTAHDILPLRGALPSHGGEASPASKAPGSTNDSEKDSSEISGDISPSPIEPSNHKQTKPRPSKDDDDSSSSSDDDDDDEAPPCPPESLKPFLKPKEEMIEAMSPEDTRRFREADARRIKDEKAVRSAHSKLLKAKSDVAKAQQRYEDW